MFAQTRFYFGKGIALKGRLDIIHGNKIDLLLSLWQTSKQGWGPSICHLTACQFSRLLQFSDQWAIGPKQCIFALRVWGGRRVAEERSTCGSGVHRGGYFCGQERTTDKGVVEQDVVHPPSVHMACRLPLQWWPRASWTMSHGPPAAGTVLYCSAGGSFPSSLFKQIATHVAIEDRLWRNFFNYSQSTCTV